MKTEDLTREQVKQALNDMEEGQCGLCGGFTLKPWTTCLDCESRLEMTVATLDDVINQLKGSTDEKTHVFNEKG